MAWILNENFNEIHSKNTIAKMSKKRALLISFLMSIGYFGLSLAYFFMGLFDPITKNPFREIIENLITLPAVIVFGIGFGGGEQAAYVGALIIYLVLWGLSYVLLGLCFNINQNKEST